MSYQPFDRNPSGIVFFGTNASDQVFESNANFTIDGTSLVATHLKISNGGNIGSAGDADAISIASNGDVTISQDLSITGNLTVDGTTTTVNSTTVTVDDPIFTLGGDTAPASDDNKDRGIEFRYHNGSTAKVGFFGFDDSAGKFTFIPDATNSSEVFSGTAGTIVAELEGNADTATALATARDFTLTGQVTSDSAVSFDGSSNAAIAVSLDKTAITGQTEITSPAAGDFILVADASDSNNLKKITRSNLLSSLGGFSNFNITDGTTSQQIDDGEDLTFASGVGVFPVVSATNTVTYNINEAGIDHDALNNFVANEHIDHSSVSISAGDGLSGGGTIASTRTLSVDINGATDLSAPAVGDELLISDASDSNAIKKADVASIVNLADHDQLTNFVANEHIDHSSVSITAGNGLTGGGTIASTRTINVVGGDGITANADEIEVTVDDSTIELSASDGSGAVRVKDAGITEAKRSRTVEAISTTKSITKDINLCTGGSGGITVTLPSAATGKIVIVKKVDSAAGTITIQRADSATIDGATTKVLYHQYEAMNLASDGTDWYIV